MPIRLALAVHEPLMIAGMEAVLTVDKGFEVIASFTDGREIEDAVRRTEPEIAVLDVGIPKINWRNIARNNNDKRTNTKVILLCCEDGPELIEAINLGVRGILEKHVSADLLMKCIASVMNGEVWIGHNIAAKVVNGLAKQKNFDRALSALLTDREIEVTKMVFAGKRNKEIADSMCICEGTVKHHLQKVYAKMGVRGRMALMRIGFVPELWKIVET